SRSMVRPARCGSMAEHVGVALVLVLALAALGALGAMALLVRNAIALDADRELLGLERPADLSSLTSVTVLVPARNEERNIRECREKIRAFDYPRFDVIVANDGSTDRTVEIARSLGVAVVDVPADQSRAAWQSGKSFVLHHAAREAKGEWL